MGKNIIGIAQKIVYYVNTYLIVIYVRRFALSHRQIDETKSSFFHMPALRVVVVVYVPSCHSSSKRCRTLSATMSALLFFIFKFLPHSVKRKNRCRTRIQIKELVEKKGELPEVGETTNAHGRREPMLTIKIKWHELLNHRESKANWYDYFHFCIPFVLLPRVCVLLGRSEHERARLQVIFVSRPRIRIERIVLQNSVFRNFSTVWMGSEALHSTPSRTSIHATHNTNYDTHS